MDLSSLIELVKGITLEKPFMLSLMLPLIGLVLLLLAINFVKFEPEEKKGVWSYRIALFTSRSIIISLLVFALASPYRLEISQTQGTPTVTVLIDNSTSMDIYGFDSDEFVKKLEQRIPVKLDYIGSGLSSRIGDGIFRHLNDKNLFLITDGNNEKDSMNFFDVVSFANRFNTTINVIKLKEKNNDASVSLKGAQTTIVDTPYNFFLAIHNAKEPVHVKVSVDNSILYDQQTNQEVIPLKYVFDKIGQHKIIAEIIDKDYFDINNKFYKVVEAVQKPEILYLSQKENSIIEDVLRAKYKITKQLATPPYDELKKYFMVVVNDRMHDISYEEGKILETYTDEGDGLVVIGGENSFKGPSSIDLILPVKVGAVEEKKSDFNFVFLIDSSGMLEGQITDREAAAVEMLKVLALRRESINVAILDFSFGSSVIHPFAPISEVRSFYDSMKSHKDDTTIDGIKWIRPAVIDLGLKAAMDFIGDKDGNNNIIIVSYGQGFYKDWMEHALEVANEIKNRKIRIHSMLVPSTFLDNRIGQSELSKLSSAGRGMFMINPTDVTLLFEKALIISNTEHWITQGLELSASVSAFNDVIPVASAISLVTTGTGAPILTVNNYNKVAVISTDDGEKWADQMYKDRNLVLTSRTFDWAVGDLNRKKDTYLKVDDARINKLTIVEYKGQSIPEIEQCKFYAKEDHYECRYVPEKIGFDELLNTEFGVNYDEEYENIGYNERDLKMLADQSKGNEYDANNIDAIVIAAKESARLKVQNKVRLDWIFVAAAMVLLLFEILVRRITQRLQSRKI